MQSNGNSLILDLTSISWQVVSQNKNKNRETEWMMQEDEKVDDKENFHFSYKVNATSCSVRNLVVVSRLYLSPRMGGGGG